MQPTAAAVLHFWLEKSYVLDKGAGFRRNAAPVRSPRKWGGELTVLYKWEFIHSQEQRPPKHPTNSTIPKTPHFKNHLFYGTIKR